MLNTTHYHIMDTEWGDVYDKCIKSLAYAKKMLRKALLNGSDSGWAVTGSMEQEAYYLFDKRYHEGQDLDITDFDIMISIYHCTGDQPCPCDEEE